MSRETYKLSNEAQFKFGFRFIGGDGEFKDQYHCVLCLESAKGTGKKYSTNKGNGNLIAHFS
jgi:hypothetical protein